MRKFLRYALILLVILAAPVVGIFLTRSHLGLLGPHIVQPSLARLDTPLNAAIRFEIAAEKPHTVAEAVQFSLKLTGNQLRFGLGHPTQYGFGAEVRSGNCIEYAHLFVHVFGMVATRGSIAAKAYVVHSSRAEMFGRSLPFPGLRDHDWVVIVDNVDKRQWFVDPTFDDAWLGWDLKANVVGDIRAGR